uniref:Leucine-rich repeat transmembrane protein FLRT2-like n=1 Tax=Petromyzon marinus TaxID=7757 RepID=A0AAJ7WSA2_PETMA|nr:leucine-rich repeat transmembrane protein FLRT2-like [Petromyzon marinus]
MTADRWGALESCELEGRSSDPAATSRSQIHPGRRLLPASLVIMIRLHPFATCRLVAWLATWLSLLASAAAEPPRACSIIRPGNVDCSFRDLVTFPCPLPNNTQVIWLNNNKLRYIPAAALQNLRNLSKLYLQNNHLTHVEQGVFDALLHLQELIAYNNPWDCSCNDIGPLSEWLNGKSNSGGTVSCHKSASRPVKDVEWRDLPDCASTQGNVTETPPFECKAPPTPSSPPVAPPVLPNRASRESASSGVAGQSWVRAVRDLTWAALVAALFV